MPVKSRKIVRSATGDSARDGIDQTMRGDSDDGSDTLAQGSSRSETSASTLEAGDEVPPPRNLPLITGGAWTQDSMAVDYCQIPGISEHSRMTMPVLQPPCDYFSSQPSVGQARTTYISAAQRRRQKANFEMFQDDEEQL